jgi:hypothetical protein
VGRNAWAGAVALVAAGIGLTVAAPPASALNVVNVTTTTDGVAGSLRAAIDTAAIDGDDTEIVLQADSTYELTVCGPTDDNANASGDLDIQSTVAVETLSITGNGATIVQTCADERVIDDADSDLLTIDGLTVTGGDTPDNGGGINTSEPFELTNSTVTDNHADGDGGGVESAFGGSFANVVIEANTSGGEGGGIDGSGGSATFSLTDSLIDGNTSVVEGGGVYASGGGVTATISGSTFVGNESTASVGGGLASFGGGSTVNVTNSTFTENTAAHGGGLATGGAGTQTLRHLTFLDNVATISGSELTDNFGANSPGFSTITMFGTILQAFSSTVCELTDPVTSEGYNIETGDSCGLGAVSDETDFDGDFFEPLADNGGPTPTLLPAFGNVVVDRIPVADCSATVTVDQRGVSRPQEGGCDVGAVEGQGDEELPPPPTEPPEQPEPPGGGPVAGQPGFTG